MSDLTAFPQFEEGHVPVVGGQMHYITGALSD